MTTMQKIKVTLAVLSPLALVPFWAAAYGDTQDKSFPVEPTPSEIASEELPSYTCLSPEEADYAGLVAPIGPHMAYEETGIVVPASECDPDTNHTPDYWDTDDINDPGFIDYLISRGWYGDPNDRCECLHNPDIGTGVYPDEV